MFCNFWEKFENSKWPPFLERENFFQNWDSYSAEIPCGSKILSKSLYLALSNDFQILIEWMYLPSFRWIDKIPFKLSSGQASPSKKDIFGHVTSLVEMSLQHIQKNSPRLLHKPAKFEKNPPNGYRVIRKTKYGAGGAWRSPIHKQASRKGRLINHQKYGCTIYHI